MPRAEARSTPALDDTILRSPCVGDTNAMPAGDLVMTKVESIEREVRDLSAFAEFDAAEWDRQLEEDVASGKLDRLADAALADHNAGRSRTL